MGNIAICTPEISDVGILTSSSEHVNFPSINLLNTQPYKIWRTNTLINTYFEINFGSAKTFSMVSLLQTNATSSAQWRIRAATTQANLTASPLYDSSSIDFWPTTGLEDWESVSGFHFIGSDKTAQWLRIDITDTSNPNGYFQASRLYVSSPWQPKVNMSYGWSIGYDDDTDHNTSSGGSTIITAHGRRRMLEFSLDFLSETEMFDNAFQIERLRGSSKDILVIPDPDNTDRIHDQSVYGVMIRLSPINNPRYNLFRKRYLVRELT